MPTLFTEADADPAALAGKLIAIIGYSETGRAAALNLRDGGIAPLIGCADIDEAARVRADGFDPLTITEAAKASNVLMLTAPDEALPELYFKHVAGNLNAGDTLVFITGYCLAFGFIEPPPFIDALMLAPRLLGSALRDVSVNRSGVLSYFAVEQDASGKAWQTLLALASVLGILHGGALEVTAQQEAELSLFVRSALMPALHHLLATMAEILIREGYLSEAVFSDLYLAGGLRHALELAAAQGLMASFTEQSTAQYAALSHLERFQDTKQVRQLEMILEEIRTGKFAQEWAAEVANGKPRLELLMQRRRGLSLWMQEKRALDLLQQARTDAESSNS
ncbi:MAG: ketol-acid reductoisomerase [Anaerolineae bacterium]